MSVNERKLCIICAWRENCNKKFSIGESKINCPDFSKDLSIKNIKEEFNEDTNIKFNKKKYKR